MLVRKKPYPFLTLLLKTTSPLRSQIGADIMAIRSAIAIP